MKLFCCFKKKVYECPYCFFSFNSKRKLKKHKEICLFSEKIFNEVFRNSKKDNLNNFDKTILIPPPRKKNK